MKRISPFRPRLAAILAAMKEKTTSVPAFTLAELIVVITVLAILATVGFLSLSGYSQDAKNASSKTNVRSVYAAISSESAATNNSPRFYVVHDAQAALSGAIAFVDGSPTVLTGGDWNAAGTNYSAGNPDWTKLKLNPEKFKVSELPKKFVSAFAVTEAAYDAKSVSVGAVDATSKASSVGKKRTLAFFQVTGTVQSTGLTSVVGDFPTPSAEQSASGGVAGLVRNPASASLTGALVDGNSYAPPSAPPDPCGTSVENATANNMLYCRWSGDVTWAAAAAMAPSGYRICKVSEFYARKTGFPAHTGDGYLWGAALAQYWGESAVDVGTYACTEPYGTCHANEHGRPY